MPKFAANLTMTFQEHPLLERFAAAAKAGFRGVEFLFPYQFAPAEIAAQLKQHQLTLALFNTPPGDWDKGERGIAILPGREAEFRGYVERALTYAKALGCEQVHVMAGLQPADVEPKRCEQVFVENLRFAATEFAKHGVRALLEPINPYDIPGYFLNTIEHARRIMDQVGHDNLYLQFDIYHRQMQQGGLTAAIEKHLQLIRHFQIAGVPGRHEPNVGEINYPYLFERIDALGYQGWIGCEYRPQGATLAGLAWARAYGIGP